MRKPNRFGDSLKRDAAAPAIVTNEIPRTAFRDVVENLRNEDARAFEGWFAAANFRISDDIIAEFAAGRVAWLRSHAKTVSGGGDARKKVCEC